MEVYESAVCDVQVQYILNSFAQVKKKKIVWFLFFPKRRYHQALNVLKIALVKLIITNNFPSTKFELRNE